tara:strand:+ start:231 stop:3035 length:2805 start_codon:yes stop_codon:yes gene_type:complete
MIKKIILIIFIPIISFSQVCYLGFNSGSIEDKCDLDHSINLFEKNNDKADPIINQILSQVGGSNRFLQVKECNGINNAIAFLRDDRRYILYDPNFLEEIDNNSKSWKNLLILAHEIGHHQNFHTMPSVFGSLSELYLESNNQRKMLEIEADEFAGFILQKLGASKEEAISAMDDLLGNVSKESIRYPGKQLRINAIKKGWENAKENISDRELSMGIEDYYNIGSQKVNENKFEEALEAYSIAVQLDPDFYKSYTNRAKIWFELGNYNESIKDNSKSINIKPTYIAYHNRAYSKYKLGRYEEAVLDYSRSIELNKDFNYNYFRRGIAKSYLDKDDEAIADFFKAIESTNETDKNYKNDISDFYYNIALSNVYLGNNEDVIHFTTKSIEYNNTASFAYKLRGDFFSRSGKFNESIKDLSESINIGFKNDSLSLGNAHFLRGKSYFFKNEYSNSIKDFNKSIYITPNNMYSYYFRGNAKFYLDDLYGSLSDYDRVLELDSSFIDALYERAKVKESLGKNEDALKDFSKSIELNSNNYRFYRGRGIFYVNNENYLDAIEDFKSAIKINSKNVELFYDLGLAYEYYYDEEFKKNNNDKTFNLYYDEFKIDINGYSNAIENYIMVYNFDNKEKNPNISYYKIKALNNLGQIYRKAGLYSESENYFKKSIQINKNIPRTYIDLALLYELMNNDNDAISSYLVAEKLTFGQSSKLSKIERINHGKIIYNNLSLLKSNKKQYDEAIFWINKGIALNPEDSEYYVNRYIYNYELGRIDHAKKDIDKAIELSPFNYKAIYNRANLRSSLNDYVGAISDYTSAIEINEKPNYYYERAKLLLNQFYDYFGAIKDFRKAIILDDNFIDDVYEKLIKNNSDNYKIFYCFGLILYEDNDERSCKFLDKAQKYIGKNQFNKIVYDGEEMQFINHINKLRRSNNCNKYDFLD